MPQMLSLLRANLIPCLQFGNGYQDNSSTTIITVIGTLRPELIDGSLQDCSDPSVSAMELLKSWIKPSIDIWGASCQCNTAYLYATFDII